MRGAGATRNQGAGSGEVLPATVCADRRQIAASRDAGLERLEASRPRADAAAAAIKALEAVQAAGAADVNVDSQLAALKEMVADLESKQQ